MESPPSRSGFVKCVASIIDPFRTLYPSVYLIHYMDDILLACADDLLVQQAAKHLIAALQQKGFHISEDKIQIHPPQLFLGFELFWEFLSSVSCLKPPF